MAIKPSPVQVALVEELIDGATLNKKYEQFEEEELRDFRDQLDRFQS